MSALMGVFLGDERPDLSPALPELDFSSPERRDYEVLQPLLKQVFFIGDGLTSAGARQQAITPAGATRLFLGTYDGMQWSNNVGHFTVGVYTTNCLRGPTIVSQPQSVANWATAISAGPLNEAGQKLSFTLTADPPGCSRCRRRWAAMGR